ncbi:MAG TPA: AMP-binding protein [Mycobacteriales bacterium]|nr:AMP-binding protein [Mycobacteriales bacterium]
MAEGRAWGTTVGNVADLVARAAQTRPDGIALLTDSDRTTWAELDAAVSRFAGGLRGLGLAAGDRVALLIGNTPDFPLAYFGALRAGLVAVPVNTGCTASELEYLLDDVGARVLLAGRADVGDPAALADEVAGLEHVVSAGTPAWEALAAAEAVDGSVRAGEDLAVIVYTSGTSGRPRGAMLTHRALVANLEQVSTIEPPVFAADDVALLVLPLFHIYGLNAGLGMVAFHAATAVLAERFEPVETLALLTRLDVTIVVGAPPMYVAWSMLPDVESAFSSVRLAISGAAPLPANVLGRVLDATGHHVFEGYGLTECAPVVTTTLLSEAAKADSIGRPVPGLEVRLLDVDGEEVDIDDAEPGEIVVRGPNLFSGYWPDGVDGPDADGWWGTGDVAYCDETGDLHLVDRRKELILVSGFNVYPREVEDVLDAHPDIVESAVIGIRHPYTGESVKALVVKREGARLSAEEVIDFAAKSLARFKCPTAVQFVDELPHSATGKVRRVALRELAVDA